jgi:acyl-coenzyme A synthetase/AMP-(fatty) acid ligase
MSISSGTEQGRFGPFEHLLDNSARVVVLQDGESISAEQLRSTAEKFVARLADLPRCRIAVCSSRADIVIAGICAAVAHACELILVREAQTTWKEFCRTLGAGAVFGDELELLHQEPSDLKPCSTSILLTTSGTTGNPKVAVHDLLKLMGRIRLGNRGQRWLLAYHPASFAGLQVLLTAFCSRALLLAYARLSAADLVLRALDSDATHLSGTPTFWRSLLLARTRLNSRGAFEQITLGGEPVDQATLDALAGAFPLARIVHIYASTEAGALFAVRDGVAGFPAQWLESGVDGCRLRIEKGVLQVLSPRAMLRYCGDSITPPLTNDGWLITGDLVEIRGDRVIFCGRLDNVINIGGGKVIPEEVEALIEALPFVEVARVHGTPNPLAGLVLTVDLVLKEPRPQAEVRHQIYQALAQRLEPYKIPRIFKFVESIPTNASGKKVRGKS